MTERRMRIGDANYLSAVAIAARLRAADVTELRLLMSCSKEEAVCRSLRCSTWARTVFVDGVPTVIYGVAPSATPDVGVPWMVATDGIGEIKRYFLMASRRELAAMARQYRQLTNFVHRDNAISINWLRWLGFRVSEVPTGPSGQFWQFWKE